MVKNAVVPAPSPFSSAARSRSANASDTPASAANGRPGARTPPPPPPPRPPRRPHTPPPLPSPLHQVLEIGVIDRLKTYPQPVLQGPEQIHGKAHVASRRLIPQQQGRQVRHSQAQHRMVLQPLALPRAQGQGLGPQAPAEEHQDDPGPHTPADQGDPAPHEARRSCHWAVMASGGMGRANQKPWARAQPKRSRRSACSRVSTPSAMVSSPRLVPRATMARASFMDSPAAAPRTKDWSIFSRSTGNCWR